RPGTGRVVGAVDRTVVLHPEAVGCGGATGHPVGILPVRIGSTLVGGDEIVAHAVGSLLPVFSAIVADPNATAGYPDGDPPGIAGIDADRVDAWEIVAAARPFRPLGPVPQAADQLPGFAV